ncbi:sulfotransferase domain-containing protein [Pseudokineococcus marinus]|uniref:Sulfotransferase n=1 Tax=Pseudokineococcus marinus TaxID=351215 RepID=A0A849BM20_9ACTN|nr:sulfotransferase domain-containing protein [Pseudokineococcus marinus]NNH21684.1 sulfotransferase [Pseudokineococcus marinus]
MTDAPVRRQRQARESEGPRVLFLGGLGRSGSTLVERMIAELPGVAPLGEVVHLWERGLLEDQQCGCGRSFHACPFWRAVGREAFGGWDRVDGHHVLQLRHAVDRTRFVPLLLLPHLTRRRGEVLSEYLSYYERVYAAALDVSGARVVVDSSKHLSLAACLRRSSVVRLRTVQMVRDSAGVAHSWGKRVIRPEITDRVEYMPVYSPLHVALLWSFTNAALRLVTTAGSRPLVLRYEDVVRAPREALASVAQHAGLPLDDGAVDFVDGLDVHLTSSHTVAGNPMRFRTGNLSLRRDDAWRTDMKPSTRALVHLLTLPVRALLGYAGPAASSDDRRDERSR